MRLKLTSEEMGCVCIVLYFGTQGYVPILMPAIGGALTTATQMNAQHGINHVILLLLWSGIFLTMLRARFFLRLDLLTARVALAYCLFAACSTLWSSVPASSISAGASLTISTIFAIFLVGRFPGERLLSLFSWVIMVHAVLSALFAVGVPHYGIDHFSHAGAWQGICAQKNSLGLVMVFGTGLGLSLQPTTFIQRAWKSVFLLLCIGEVVLSQSREAWAVCALILFTHFALELYSRLVLPSRGPALIVLSLGALVGCAAIAAFSASILKLLGRDPTLTGRTVLWQAVLQQCRNHPVGGYGLGGFWATGDSFPVYSMTHWVPTSAHNGFLECLLELGSVGLILLLALVFLSARNATTIVTSQPKFDTSRAWIYSLLSITALNMVGDVTGITNSISWLLLVCAACRLEENSHNAGLALNRFAAPARTAMMGMRVLPNARV